MQMKNPWSMRAACVLALLFMVQPSQAAASTYTYVTCYFTQYGSTEYPKWQWGLNASSGWYTLPGTWMKTPFTSLTKFRTTTSYADIYAACQRAKGYYGQQGELFAIFAADSGSGSNYPIVLGDVELFATY